LAFIYFNQADMSESTGMLERDWMDRPRDQVESIPAANNLPPAPPAPLLPDGLQHHNHHHPQQQQQQLADSVRDVAPLPPPPYYRPAKMTPFIGANGVPCRLCQWNCFKENKRCGIDEHALRSHELL